MGQIWKDIKGYQGLYQGSTFGRLKNLKRNTIRSLDQLKNGHYQVKLCKNNHYKNFLVHRLIFETFFGPIPEGFICHHISGDGLWNNIDNLTLLECGEHQKLHRKVKTNKKDPLTGRFVGN